MAVDLKIEEFSVKLLHYMWEKLYGIRASNIRRDPDEAPEFFELSDEIICAVYTRVSLFQNGYQSEFQRDYYRFCKSGVDLYFYIEHCFHKFSNNLNAFDKFLLVCSIVSILGGVYIMFGNDIYTEIAPLCCAMFMDTNLKDEFYEAGGWDALKKHASTYKNVLKDFELGNNDLKNAFKVFDAASSNFNMGEIYRFFQRRWNMICNYQNDIDLCSKCSMLSSALTGLLLERESLGTNNNNIESLLQLTLYMQSLYEQSDDASDVAKKLGKLDIHPEKSDNSKLATNQACDNVTTSDNFKSMRTLKLFQTLFGESDETPDEENDSDEFIYKYTCMMCFTRVFIPQKKKSEYEKSVESVIMKKVHSFDLEDSSKYSEDIQPDNTAEGPQPECSKNHQKTEIVSLYKEPLRYFIALGTEPAKSLIASGFKNNTDVSDNVEKTQKTPSKQKKRQRKKKKTEKSDN